MTELADGSLQPPGEAPFRQPNGFVARSRRLAIGVRLTHASICLRPRPQRFLPKSSSASRLASGGNVVRRVARSKFSLLAQIGSRKTSDFMSVMRTNSDLKQTAALAFI